MWAPDEGQMTMGLAMGREERRERMRRRRRNREEGPRQMEGVWSKME
jgi:hypothetical protein